VVGPGSLHASGAHYAVAIGSPDDIDNAPASLVDLLRRPDRHRSTVDGAAVDISDNDLRDLVMAIDNSPDTDYEVFIRVGMGIHEVTKGVGYDLWVAWSAKNPAKHDPKNMDYKWQSFGKSANPVTLGTLRHYAEQSGWQQSVTFTDNTDWQQQPAVTLDTTTVDLLRPPGFVGELTLWINSQCIYPREHLAVAAALQVVSCCGGMRYYDPLDYSAFNLFSFGVADSATGKESILRAHNELLRAAGLAGALVGGIKSEQEIYRNLVRHQAAFYAVDELGEHLAKIQNASKRGGATYLEGVIGALMSIYSKSNSFVPVTGDLKEEIRNGLIGERSRLQKRIDEHDDKNGLCTKRVARIDQSLKTIDMGLENPFLSIFGLTTPGRFNGMLDMEMADNGILGRALVFQELESNPRIKPRDQRARSDVPDRIKYALINLYAPGYAGDHDSSDRVEQIGPKSPIQTRPDAVDLLEQCAEAFHALAERHKESTGMTPIPRRAYEQVSKVSAILAMPGGVRTAEHVLWAYALVSRDVDVKMRIAYSNGAATNQDKLYSRILSLVNPDHGETVGVIANKCRAYKKSDVELALSKLVELGELIEREHKPTRGPVSKKYFSAGG
jgi:hypothetical protein